MHIAKVGLGHVTFEAILFLDVKQRRLVILAASYLSEPPVFDPGVYGNFAR